MVPNEGSAALETIDAAVRPVPPSAPIPEVGRVLHGRDVPAIYGTLLVPTLIVVQKDAASVEVIAFSVVLSVVVFWITHVWVGILDRQTHGPITRAEAAGIARHEAPMLTAVVAPVLMLALGSFSVTPIQTAITLALVASIVQLFVWGLAVGRALRRGPLVTLGVAVVDCGLGLIIVVLKIMVIH